MRRIQHPHGMELMSGTLFWIRDGHEDAQGSYWAAVEAKPRRLARYDETNLHVMTEAQQILWTRDLASVGITPTPRQRIEMPCVLRPAVRHWLESEISARGPDWYVRDEPFDLLFQSILFRRRRDALALVRHVAASLREHRD